MTLAGPDTFLMDSKMLVEPHLCTMYSRYWEFTGDGDRFPALSQPLELALWMERHKEAHVGKREFTDSDNCPTRNKVMSRRLGGSASGRLLIEETSPGGDSFGDCRGVWSGRVSEHGEGRQRPDPGRHRRLLWGD